MILNLWIFLLPNSAVSTVFCNCQIILYFNLTIQLSDIAGSLVVWIYYP